MRHCRAVRSAVTVLWAQAAVAQVTNLRFLDTDTTSSSIGGWLRFEKPVAGDSGIDFYAAYLAQDSSGTGQVQIGADLRVGADTSDLEVPTGTSTTGFTYILVYLKTSGTLSSPAYICLLEKATNYVRTFYVLTTGYANAASAKSALVSGCHAYSDAIAVEMVAVQYWDGSAIQATSLDDSNEASTTASFAVIFSTSSTLSTISTLLSSYTSGALLPTVFTGTSTDASYSLGTVHAYSKLDDAVNEQSEPDTAVRLGRALIFWQAARAVTVNRRGYLHVHTAVASQTAVQTIATAYNGCPVDSITFETLGAASSDLTAIGARATATSMTCTDDQCTWPATR